MKKISIRPIFFPLCLITLLLLAPNPAFPLTGAHVGVYDDTSYQNGGTWDTGLGYIAQMLSTYGYTYEFITPDDINTTSDLNSYFNIILFGGGWAEAYNTLVNSSGFDNIRLFVNNGGGFFGICAGAYFACDVVIWKESFKDPFNVYNYPLDLFKGNGAGALLGITGWNDPTGCTENILQGAAMTTLRINQDVFPDLGEKMDILYYGGPMFTHFGPSLPDENLQVVSYYDIPGALTDGTPAMVMFTYGEGRVFLTGPHPEVVFQNCDFTVSDTNWAFMDQILQKLFNTN